jgi:hypothetical protein
MKVKKVYICSEHTDAKLELNSTRPLFAEVQAIIASVPDMAAVSETLGESDIAIRGDNLLFTGSVEENVRKRLATFAPSSEASTGIELFGTRYPLDVRNDSHMMMRSIGILLKMLLAEREKNGTVWFYDMSPVDDINRAILSVVKNKKRGIAPWDILEKIKRMDEAYMSLSADTFQERLEMLKAHQFITEKSSRDGIAGWGPTEKTIKIDSIF